MKLAQMALHFSYSYFRDSLTRYCLKFKYKEFKVCTGGFLSFLFFFPLVQQWDKDEDTDWKYIHAHPSMEILVCPDPTLVQSLKLRRCMSVSLRLSDNCRVSAQLSRFSTVLR